MQINPVLMTDSYKAGHFDFYPPDTEYITSYLTARGSNDPLLKRALFFGLQPMLEDFFTRRVTASDVNEAELFFSAHGEPFNEAGWLRIAHHLDGQLPISIRALPEGARAAFGEPLVVVENTRPGFHWLPSYVETQLMRVWYPTTVATFSDALRQVIDLFAAQTSDHPEGANFMLHDFGARGSTSSESAQLGGMAHLVSFGGTDTVEAVVAARRYYGEHMAGHSVPATEHSTMTAWGEDGELAAFERMIERYPGKIVSIVSDSWSTYRVVNEYLPKLKDQVVASGARLVVRLDSGDPVKMVIQTLEGLAQTFGVTVNSKGYKVLNNVGVLQGDGIDAEILRQILVAMTNLGWATDNVVFGMGGALLQKHNRDTLKFAYKACRRVDSEGVTHQLHKRSEDAWKASKTYAELDTSRLMEVFRDGEILKRSFFGEVRERAAQGRNLFGNA